MGDRLTNRDLKTFLHNAEITTVDRITSDREELVRVWKTAVVAEALEWADKDDGEYPTDKELVFILTSAAAEVQQRVTKREAR